MAKSLQPLADRVLVRPLKAEEVRASGIVIPDTAKEKPQEGEILAIGPGKLDDNGKRVTIPSYVVTAQEEPTLSYSRAIDISHPEVVKTGTTAARASREAAEIKAASDAESAAPKAPAAAPAAPTA